MVQFKVEGLDKLLRELKQLEKDVSAPEMAKRMRPIRCPEHGTSARDIRVIGHEVKAEFCCERLRDLALSAAAAPIRGRR
jgi:hypothetical protein